MVCTLLMGMLLASPQLSYGWSFVAGDPTGYYFDHQIQLETGESFPIQADSTLLFVEGTVIPNYEVLIEKDRALVPIRVISEGLGFDVVWHPETLGITIRNEAHTLELQIASQTAKINGKEVTLEVAPKLYQNLTYVPIRFVAESLDAEVVYTPALAEPYQYFYDTSMPVSTGGTLVRQYANILVDKRRTDEGQYASTAEAQAVVEAFCREGLAHFREALTVSIVAAGGDASHLDQDFARIEKDINHMLSLGKVSRYWTFTIGVYDILLDSYTDAIYFIRYSSGIQIHQVDVSDPDLYLYVYIVG